MNLSDFLGTPQNTIMSVMTVVSLMNSAVPVGDIFVKNIISPPSYDVVMDSLNERKSLDDLVSEYVDAKDIDDKKDEDEEDSKQKDKPQGEDNPDVEELDDGYDDRWDDLAEQYDPYVSGKDINKHKGGAIKDHNYPYESSNETQSEEKTIVEENTQEKDNFQDNNVQEVPSNDEDNDYYYSMGM